MTGDVCPAGVTACAAACGTDNPSASSSTVAVAAAGRADRFHRRNRTFDASSKSEYATGVATSVSTRTSDWPPMMTKPIARLVADPTPLDSTSGIIPATNAKVVIRIGRRRSRLACRIAASRSMPRSRS